MLKSFRVKGFKSLLDVRLELPSLGVLFGPNAVGKSNFLDALQALARLGTEKTLAEALTPPIRGYAAETFSLSEGGLSELLQRRQATFSLSADIEAETGRQESARGPRRLRYSVEVQIEPPKGGRLSVRDEYLSELTADWEPKGTARLERQGDVLVIRRRSQPGRATHESVGLNHTQLSNRRYSDRMYIEFDIARRELSSWRIYYLEPRELMRRAVPPAEVDDIGVLGENLAPYLYRLRRQYPDVFQQLVRTVRSVIPSIKSVEVDLDERRGTLDIQVRQDDTLYSSRVISEGTLRVIALCALAVNPNPPTLISFEEPENGVQPARIEAVAKLLANIARLRRSQVLVTTHSPLFASTILALGREDEMDVGLFRCFREGRGSQIERFQDPGDLFTDAEIQRALTAHDESLVFEAMFRRGWLDA